MAVNIKDNNNSNLYYIHKDHLGSYQVISNSSGALVEEMSYSPCSVKLVFCEPSETKSIVELIPISIAVREGRRRKASNWNDYSLTSAPMFARGFTGHEHLQEFNLINMNGRVYDPILGRFLSPDNYIQLPDYTQSLNRYSYCLNNPLIYTDPSGNEWRWGNPFYHFDRLATKFMDWVNDNTEALRDAMVDAGIPAFNVGINSAGDTYHEIGGYRVDHAQARVDRAIEGNVNAVITKVRKEHGAAWMVASYGEMFSTKSKSITISTSTPFDGNGLRGGYGVSVGQFEGMDSQGLYLTTYKGEGVSLSFSLDKTYCQPLLDRPVNIQDLAGSGYSLEFGLSFVGYSLGNNGYVQDGQGFHYIQPTYRSHTISVSYGMDLGYANWETKTRVLPLPKWLYKLLYR